MKTLLRALTVGFLLLLIGVIPAAVAQDGGEGAEPTGTPQDICDAAVPAEEPETREYEAAEFVLDPTLDYYAVFCTEYGPITIDLFEDLAPLTVNNFVFLAENGFYNNLTFHRVIADFMAQGGDPEGTGAGGPGYQFEDEFVRFVTFDRPGLLAMANSGPSTNGSQFFITTVVTDWLTYNHTIFGEVIDGQANTEAIPVTEVAPNARLDTVVVLTDREQIDIDYEAPEAITEDDILAELETLQEIPGLELDGATGSLATDAFVASLPDLVQEDATGLFSDHNHQFSVTVRHSNTACDLEAVPLERIQYQIHVFETAQDASQALLDERVINVITEGEAFEEDTLSFSGLPLYTWEGESSCDLDTVEVARTVRNVGRFLLVTEGVLPESDQFDAQILDGINLDIYELLFFDILRQEVSTK